MIDSYLLEYFLAFYEEGTLLKASEKLHISQPSLTKAMQKLEEELDISLFERSPNRLQLNENAKILVDYMKDIISLNERLLEKSQELKKKEATLKIGMTALGPTFRYPAFFYFQQDKYHYQLQIEDENSCIKKIKNDELDIAFINSLYSDQECETKLIATEHLYISLPKTHFLAKKNKPVTFQKIDGQSFLVIKELGIWENVLHKHLQKSRFFFQEGRDIQEVIDASSMPAFATNITMNFRAHSDRVFLPIEEEDACINFYALYRKKNKKYLEMIESARLY